MVKEEEKEVYRLKEFAKMIDVSLRTAYRLVETGKVKAIKIGGNWRVPKSEIRKLLGGDNG
jgi:excisionase family DNA binding protein